MRYLLLIIALLSSACGEPDNRDGDVRHLFAEHEEKREQTIIFSSPQPNGQHCFYGKDVGSEVVLIREEISKLTSGSELLTPRSLLIEDVRDAWLMKSRDRNRASHLSYYPLILPVELTCIVPVVGAFLLGHKIKILDHTTLGKVSLVSCGIAASLFLGALGFNAKGTRKSGISSTKLVSPQMSGTEPETIAHLHKIFTWLESRDAEQCPAKIAPPATVGRTQAKEK